MSYELFGLFVTESQDINIKDIIKNVVSNTECMMAIIDQTTYMYSFPYSLFSFMNIFRIQLREHTCSIGQLLHLNLQFY